MDVHANIVTVDGAVAFDTTIRRISTARQSRVSNRGLLALIPIALLAVGLHFVLPQHLVKDVMGGVIGLFVIIYTASLSRAVKPKEEPARVWAGPDGLRTDSAWLAPQSAILQAVICRPTQGGSYDGVRIASWPWTVMIATDSDRFWLTLGSEEEGRRLLECLGRPVVVQALGAQ